MTAALGWVGSVLVVLSLTQRDMLRLRQVNLAASAALGVFNVALGIGSMIALNAVLAGVNGYHLLRRRFVDRPRHRAAIHQAESTSSFLSPNRAQVDTERRFAAAGLASLHRAARL